MKAAARLLELEKDAKHAEKELSPKMKMWVKKLKEVLQEAEELNTLELVADATQEKLRELHEKNRPEEEAQR